MNKKFSKGSLLKGDGVTLCEEGYNEKSLKSYNIKNIRQKGLLKFTDCFNFSYYESGLLILLTVKRKRFWGIIEFSVTDILNQKTIDRKIVEVFSAGKYSFNKNNELHIKNNEVNFEFIDGKKKKLSFVTKGSDKINFNAEITNNTQCQCVTANQYNYGFDYSKNSVGYNVEGELSCGEKKYNLRKNNDSVVSINSRLSVLKSVCKEKTIFAVGRINDKVVSVILDTISEKNQTSSSMIVYDGYTYKLEGVVSMVEADDYCTFLSSDQSLNIKFTQHILHFDNKLNDYGIKIGKLSGQIILKNEDVVKLENFKAFVAYNGRIM